MMMKLMRTSLAAAIALTLLVPAAHVAAEKSEKTETTAKAEKSDKASKREKLKAEYKAKMMKRLSEKLKLDEATAKKPGAIIGAQHKEMRSLRKNMRACSKKLKALTNDENSSESDIQAQLDELKNKQAQASKMQAKYSDQIGKLLGPRKTAQYMVLRQKWMEKMRSKVEGKRSKRSRKNKDK
ncbi:MAG: hypothetical protein JKX97_07895 [Candidatus Lindowbacteria bacterium]|nr:hypothetical protein [Candidatus Lindowbacteria bacterium]